MQKWQTYWIRFSRLTRWLVFACIYILGSNSLASNLTKYLNSFPKIRVPITSAPGNGHQSAGVTVIENLRDLGYTGLIEVVWDFPSTADKLAYLLPPFRGFKGGPRQEFPEQKLRVIEFSEIERTPVGLTILGADDYNMEPEIYNSQILIQLQPRGWHGNRQIVFFPLKRKKKVKDQSLQDLANLHFRLSASEPKDLDDYLRQIQKLTPLSTSQVALFQTLLDPNLESDLLPFYGHGTQTSPLEYNKAHQIYTLIRALDGALRERPEKSTRKGVLVPIFNELESEELYELRALLDQKENPLHPSSRVRFLTKLDRINNKDELIPTHPNEIVVVVVGSTPKPLFDLIFKRSSLPAVVEGLNSINMMHSLGVPFLPSSREEEFRFDETFVSGLSTAEIKFMYLLYLAHEDLMTEESSLRAEDISDISNLKRLLLKSMIEPLEIRSFFDRLKAYTNSKPTLLEDALKRAISMAPSENLSFRANHPYSLESWISRAKRTLLSCAKIIRPGRQR